MDEKIVNYGLIIPEPICHRVSLGGRVRSTVITDRLDLGSIGSNVTVETECLTESNMSDMMGYRPITIWHNANTRDDLSDYLGIKLDMVAKHNHLEMEQGSVRLGDHSVFSIKEIILCTLINDEYSNPRILYESQYEDCYTLKSGDWLFRRVRMSFNPNLIVFGNVRRKRIQKLGTYRCTR